MRTDIIYSEETLFIYLEGKMNKKGVKTLNSKINNIVDEYKINDVVINTKNIVGKNQVHIDDFFIQNNCYIKLI